MITEITYIAVPGLTYITSVELAYKKLLVVHREHKQRDIVLGTPVNTQVRHDMVTGFLYFDINLPFAGSGQLDTDQESVNVIYLT